jgi:phosphoribosyl-AMP cyclohydrolase
MTLKITESMAIGEGLPLVEALDRLPWNEEGLLPAIAQQHDTREVLMLAWMNRAALEESLSTGRVCYWSRSRQRFWRKGEESGQIQKLLAVRLDCDGDAILLEVDQLGPACHSGRRSCFYNRIQGDQLLVETEPLIDPSSLYAK